MQFLPSSWAQYGVDANGDGFKDPYNPADAIFAAARYLRAAGGDDEHHGRRLRLQPLAGLRRLGDAARAAARRHAARTARRDHGADRGALPGARGRALQRRLPERLGRGLAGARKTLVGTAIYSQAGAPVIAVQDGEVVQIGRLARARALRRRCATPTATPTRTRSSATSPRCTRCSSPTSTRRVSPRIDSTAGAHEPAPSGPATRRRAAALADVAEAGPCPASPSARRPALEAARRLRRADAAAPPPAAAPAAHARRSARAPTTSTCTRCARGVQVIAGTVLGHVGAGTAAARAAKRRRTSSSRSARPAPARR